MPPQWLPLPVIIPGTETPASQIFSRGKNFHPYLPFGACEGRKTLHCSLGAKEQEGEGAELIYSHLPSSWDRQPALSKPQFPDLSDGRVMVN